MDDPTEEYGEFDSWAEWFAARFQLRGPAALKTTLSELIATGECSAEHLQEPAAELAAMGLMKPAKLVRSASRKCQALTDLDRFWPYSPRGRNDPTIIKAAKASQQRRADKAHKRIEELLQQAGLTVDWLNGDK
jgi:hypothetical protein